MLLDQSAVQNKKDGITNIPISQLKAFVNHPFMVLDDEKMDELVESVATCLKNNQSKVGNIKGYLRATVFNASVTIDNYYQAEVNYDLSHPIPPKSNSRTYDFEALEREVLAN